MKNISVIIPTKEEAQCLPHTVAELRNIFGAHIYEIIVVDAHSQDGTAELARELGCVTLLQQKPGYGSAMQEGLLKATGDLVLFFDADGSYDPVHLPLMLEALGRGNDAVFCTRYHPLAGSDDDTWIRFAGNMIFTILLRTLFSVRLTDALHLYVLARRSSAISLPMQSPDFAWCIEFPIHLQRRGFRYCEMPARERPRRAGLSKVNALTDGCLILSRLLRLRFQG